MKKKKRRPIGVRILSFVLAFAMVFSSISFTDMGSMEVHAAVQNFEYGSDTIGLKELYDDIKTQYSGKITTRYRFRAVGSTGEYTEINSLSQDTTTINVDGTEYELQEYKQTGGNWWNPTMEWVDLDGFKLVRLQSDEVIFKSLGDGETAYSVDYNFYYAQNPAGYSALTSNLYAAVIDAENSNAGVNADTIAVKLYSETEILGAMIGSWDAFNEINKYSFADGGDGSTEQIKITYDGVDYGPITIQLNEVRPSASITQNTAAVSLEAMPDTTAVADYFTVTGLNGAAVASDSISYEISGDFPTDGNTADLTVKVTVENNAASLATSGTYTVSVTNPIYKTQMNVTQPAGAEIKVFSDEACTAEVAAGAEVEGGDYYVTVTPEGVYYVDGIEVTGTETTENADVIAVEEGVWTENVYKTKITVPAGLTQTNNVTVSANVHETVIALKETINTVSFNPAMNLTDEQIAQSIYDAAVDEANSVPAGITFEECEISFVNRNIAYDEYNNFVITWKADEKHPEVSEEVSIYISADKQKAVIDTSNANAETVVLDEQPTAEELKALVEEAAANAGV